MVVFTSPLKRPGNSERHGGFWNFGLSNTFRTTELFFVGVEGLDVTMLYTIRPSTSPSALLTMMIYCTSVVCGQKDGNFSSVLNPIFLASGRDGATGIPGPEKCDLSLLVIRYVDHRLRKRAHDTVSLL